MTEPLPQQSDDTRDDAPAPSGPEETGARERLRQDLGERPDAAGTETGGDLEQAAPIGETDDPQGGSVQAAGSRPV